MNKIGLSHPQPLPCLAVLTLACLNPTNLYAEDTEPSETVSSTSSSIIQVDETMLPALLTPMSHLVATSSLESATVQDNSLAMPQAAIVRAVIAHHHKTPTNRLNTDDSAPSRKIELPRAKDFTPTTTSSTISHHIPTTNPLSFAMVRR